jgi:segregation and condensation protein B
MSEVTPDEPEAMATQAPQTPGDPASFPPVAPPVAEVTEEQLRLAEALIFAASEPVPPRALVQALPDGADADAVLAALAARYAGRGVELAPSAGGWQFRTAPDLAPALTRVIPQPRRLPRAAMETLAIIAYHQPVTRAEIEEIRGASVSQATLDALLEAGLVGPRGRRETPGRPALWGTTANFLAQFQLQSLRDLPRREDLLVETPNASNAAPAPAEEAAGELAGDAPPEGEAPAQSAGAGTEPEAEPARGEGGS